MSIPTSEIHMQVSQALLAGFLAHTSREHLRRSCCGGSHPSVFCSPVKESRRRRAERINEGKKAEVGRREERKNRRREVLVEVGDRVDRRLMVEDEKERKKEERKRGRREEDMLRERVRCLRLARVVRAAEGIYGAIEWQQRDTRDRMDSGGHRMEHRGANFRQQHPSPTLIETRPSEWNSFNIPVSDSVLCCGIFEMTDWNDIQREYPHHGLWFGHLLRVRGLHSAARK